MPYRQQNRFAWVTPSGRGGVASVICAGPQTPELLRQLFRPAFPYPPPLPRNRPLFGFWFLSELPPVHEEVVVVQETETQFELHCHGGIAVQSAIGSGLLAAGFEPRPWRQWLRESTQDPIQAEAQIALAEALTTQTAARLLAQYHGALQDKLKGILDCAEVGDTRAASLALDRLLATREMGLHLTQPWKVVLTGAPNVGKSSLLNALLGYQRAIVKDEPGTTRDVLLGTTSCQGWPIQLMDTAGVRSNPSDEIEAQGMVQVHGALAEADLVVHLRESGGKPHLPLPPDCVPRRQLWVTNKCDIADHDVGAMSHDLRVSALSGAGLETLMHQMVASLVDTTIAPDEALLFTQELVQDFQQAREWIAIENWAEACQVLRPWRVA